MKTDYRYLGSADGLFSWRYVMLYTYYTLKCQDAIILSTGLCRVALSNPNCNLGIALGALTAPSPRLHCWTNFAH